MAALWVYRLALAASRQTDLPSREVGLAAPCPLMVDLLRLVGALQVRALAAPSPLRC